MSSDVAIFSIRVPIKQTDRGDSSINYYEEKKKIIIIIVRKYFQLILLPFFHQKYSRQKRFELSALRNEISRMNTLCVA